LFFFFGFFFYILTSITFGYSPRIKSHPNRVVQHLAAFVRFGLNVSTDGSVKTVFFDRVLDGKWIPISRDHSRRCHAQLDVIAQSNLQHRFRWPGQDGDDYVIRFIVRFTIITVEYCVVMLCQYTRPYAYVCARLSRRTHFNCDLSRRSVCIVLRA